MRLSLTELSTITNTPCNGAVGQVSVSFEDGYALMGGGAPELRDPPIPMG